MNPSQKPALMLEALQEADTRSIIDDIIKIKRRKDQSDLQAAITDEDRQAVVEDALGMYRLLAEKMSADGQILVEYKKGLRKIVERLVLDN